MMSKILDIKEVKKEKIIRLYVIENLDCLGQFKVGITEIVKDEDEDENHFYHRIRALSQSGTTLAVRHFYIGPERTMRRLEKEIKKGLPKFGFQCKQDITNQTGHSEWFLGDINEGIKVVDVYALKYNKEINHFNSLLEDNSNKNKEIKLGDMTKVRWNKEQDEEILVDITTLTKKIVNE